MSTVRAGFAGTCAWGTRRALALCVAVCAVAFGACHRSQVTPAGTAVGDDLLFPYLQIQEGLVKDSLDGLSTQATRIAEAGHKRGASGAAIEADAQQLKSATTLAEARDRFGVLSEALVAYQKSSGRILPVDVRQAYCPMVKKSWLQRGSMISNPYYGKEMPNCGEFK